jgi:hypothetical protein
MGGARSLFGRIGSLPKDNCNDFINDFKVGNKRRCGVELGDFCTDIF